MSTEEIELKCPVCGKLHVVEKKVDTFICKDKLLAIVKDRRGWRFMNVEIITEKQDRELDRLWGSEDEG